MLNSGLKTITKDYAEKEKVQSTKRKGIGEGDEKKKKKMWIL